MSPPLVTPPRARSDGWRGPWREPTSMEADTVSDTILLAPIPSALIAARLTGLFAILVIVFGL